MDLIALVEPSQGVEPGHMVIGQESEDGSSRYFGFRFNPASLPPEFQSAERWQEYLYSNKVPGNIHNEAKYVRDLRDDATRVALEKRSLCANLIETQIPPRNKWRLFASYSFRPDDFHSDADPCYNCVTWAIMIGNSMVEGFLKPVRQGRIKSIIKQIRSDAK
jgi:hypothetical protein